MDQETRMQRIQALEAIKANAEKMVTEGADAMQVRDFIDEGKTRLAYELPDLDAAEKAFEAVARFKASRRD
jgi:hypothetical protein|tara:strand:+ start:220 stop:432 length:213 start_codon:yes stop_codon:yes gene_type:complete